MIICLFGFSLHLRLRKYILSCFLFGKFKLQLDGSGIIQTNVSHRRKWRGQDVMTLKICVCMYV